MIELIKKKTQIVSVSINIRGSAECLGGCMMSVSWHCIKAKERPGRAAYRNKSVEDGAGFEVMISSEEK